LLDIIRLPFRALSSGMLVVLLGCLLVAGSFGKARSAELVMLEEDGCPWCELWREEIGGIYAITDEGKIAPLRALDINKPLPDDLKFLVKGGYTPTFILVHEGKEYGRIRGYPGESFFWGLLSVLIDKLPKSDKSST